MLLTPEFIKLRKVEGVSHVRLDQCAYVLRPPGYVKPLPEYIGPEFETDLNDLLGVEAVSGAAAVSGVEALSGDDDLSGPVAAFGDVGVFGGLASMRA